jgi:hypothetical protein
VKGVGHKVIHAIAVIGLKMCAADAADEHRCAMILAVLTGQLWSLSYNPTCLDHSCNTATLISCLWSDDGQEDESPSIMHGHAFRSKVLWRGRKVGFCIRTFLLPDNASLPFWSFTSVSWRFFTNRRHPRLFTSLP